MTDYLSEREALIRILNSPLPEPSRGRTFSEMLADNILTSFGFRNTGNWEHCSPALISGGLNCGETPRRACQCDPPGSHDHWVVTRPPQDRWWDSYLQRWVYPDEVS